MPSLQSLYQEQPMKDYFNLGMGAVEGMGYEGYNRAMARQIEQNRLIDMYNQQVVDKANPALIEHQRLANQQQQYMMPTYEEQGMAAKSKMTTPDYYSTARAAEVAKNRAAQAESMNNFAGQQASAPFVAPTTVATAQAAQTAAEGSADTAATTRMYQVLTDPRMVNVSDTEAKDYINKRFPNQAKQINALIDKHGFRKAAQMLAEQLKGLALLDPKYIQEANKPQSQQNLDPYALALEAARIRLGPNASKDDVTELAFNLLALRQPSAQPSASTETRRLVQNPDGTYSLVKEKTNTPGIAPEPAKEVTIPTGAKALGKAPPGTPDGARTMGGKPVVVKDGIVYGK